MKHEIAKNIGFAVLLGVAMSAVVACGHKAEQINKANAEKESSTSVPKGAKIGTFDGDVSLYFFNDNENQTTCYLARKGSRPELSLSCVPMVPLDD